MTADDLIAFIMRRPFVPYTIRMKDGAEYSVDQWHHAATTRNASRCTIFPTGGEAFETLRFADIDEIVAHDASTL